MRICQSWRMRIPLHQGGLLRRQRWHYYCFSSLIVSNVWCTILRLLVTFHSCLFVLTEKSASGSLFTSGWDKQGSKMHGFCIHSPLHNREYLLHASLMHRLQVWGHRIAIFARVSVYCGGLECLIHLRRRTRRSQLCWWLYSKFTIEWLWCNILPNILYLCRLVLCYCRVSRYDKREELLANL